MSTLGKVLVVLVLVFSIAFSVLAVANYSARINYQEKYAKAKTQVEEAEAAQTAAERDKMTTLNQMEILRKDHQKEAALLQKQRDDFEDKWKVALDERKQAREDFNAMKGTLETSQKNLADANAQRKELRTALEQSQQDRDKATRDRNKHRDELNEMKHSLQVTLRRNRELETQLSEKVQIIQKLGGPQTLAGLEPKAGPSEVEPAHKVRGIVKEVNAKMGLVTVTIGQDDGLRKGHELIVFRTEPEAEYVGRIRIIELRADSAVGRTIPEVQRGAYREGDHVASRLSGG